MADVASERGPTEVEEVSQYEPRGSMPPPTCSTPHTPPHLLLLTEGLLQAAEVSWELGMAGGVSRRSHRARAVAMRLLLRMLGNVGINDSYYQ